MIIFLVFNIGVVLNIFVAVIAVLYDKLAEQKNIFQMIETLKIRSITQADKDYSALISVPAPLNVILIFLGPFLLTSRNPQRVNFLILLIAYFPVMVGVTLVFVVYNVLLIPLAYVKLWWHKLIMVYVYSKSYRVSKADKFITFCIFWIFGLPFMSLNCIVDIWHFLRHLWLSDLLKVQHKTSLKQLSKPAVEKLGSYFKTKADKILPYKQVATDVRDDLGIIRTVLRILQPVNLVNFVMDRSEAPGGDRSKFVAGLAEQNSVSQMHSQVKEYTVIKDILDRNSDYIRPTEESHRIKTIDCQILFTMLQDSMRHKTVLKVESDTYIFVRRAVE